MTIKEMEQRSGLQRANIRFYEEEGLLCPQRLENGYRNYSDSDLQQIRRIRLLRTLGLGLDEIRALQKGEVSLDSVLARHAAALEQQAAESRLRAQLCQRIRQDGAQYDTLDGQRWLDTMSSVEPAAPAVPKTDTWHKVTAPWRRLFARLLDDFLYTTVWVLFGLLVIHKSPATDTGAAWTTLAGFVSVLLMVLIEPLFLSTWGTTPGKWLLGLSVRNNTGQKLSYGEAFYRTVQALWYGIGFWLPVYNLVRGYKCYYDCTDGKTLEWEWDSELQLKDEASWRVVAVVAAVVVLLLARFGAAQLAALPPNRGDISVAEFAQNYNHLAGYHDYVFRLDSDGTWRDLTGNGEFVISLNEIDAPDFICTEENGVMTSLTFTLTVTGDKENWVPVFTSRRVLAAMAYVSAHAPALGGDELNELIRAMEESPFQDLQRTVHGVRITWDVSYAGYHSGMLSDLLIPMDEVQTPSCSMTFTMEKVS